MSPIPNSNVLQLAVRFYPVATIVGNLVTLADYAKMKVYLPMGNVIVYVAVNIRLVAIRVKQSAMGTILALCVTRSVRSNASIRSAPKSATNHVPRVPSHATLDVSTRANAPCLVLYHATQYLALYAATKA